jgi:hypothetical protein
VASFFFPQNPISLSERVKLHEATANEATGMLPAESIATAKAWLSTSGSTSRDPGYGVTDTGRNVYGSGDFGAIKGENFMVDGVEETPTERRVYLARPIGGGRFEQRVAIEERAGSRTFVVRDVRGGI